MKKAVCVLLSLVLALGMLTVGASAAAAAANGWSAEDGGWRYYSGGTAQTGWVSSNGSWYYMDPGTGIMLDGQWLESPTASGTWYYLLEGGKMATGWQKIGGSWYLFGSNGKMLTGWQKVSGSWYYMDKESGIMLSDQYTPDGYYVLAGGKMATGWQQIGDSWYLFDSNGKMLTGWQKVNGSWYFMDETTGAMYADRFSSDSRYYFLSNGKMATGWQHLRNIFWFYFGTDGAKRTGWQQINGTWYCFSDFGYMYTDSWQGSYYLTDSGAMATGWQKIGNSWYYFGSNGSRLTGWQQIGGTWYYMDTDTGAMLSEEYTPDGRYMLKSGKMATGWQQIGSSWYYFGTNGAKQTDWLKYNGSWYYLDPARDGKMLTDGTYYISGSGMCIFNDKGVFTGYAQTPDEPDEPDVGSDVQVGDIITFGTYEQDNKTADGKEAIEWCVLAVDGDSALVISKYALDALPYNTTETSVTWETCTLRKWLNETFYNTAFTAAEQAKIKTTTVTTPDNSYHGTEGGNDTQDKVFLLSMGEVTFDYYRVSDNASRMCVPTAYAIAQGAAVSEQYTKDGSATCWWWLRTPGTDSTCVTLVYTEGTAGLNGLRVNFNNYDVGAINSPAVRPAMWIDLAA